jgi:SAM-dependent methyltransferase
MNSAHRQLCGSPEWAAHLQQEILPRVVDGVDLGADLLELGPGAGAATDWLRQRVVRVTALDVEPGAADLLHKRFPDGNVTVLVGDCTDGDFAAESFDSVACFTMLHHLPTAAAQHSLLAEAFRLLRPGGVLVGSDSLGSNDLHHFHADDDYHPVDAARLLVLLELLGFRRIWLLVDDELLFSAQKPSLDSPGR